MGLNDRHFTNPDIFSGWTLEQHRNEVGFRQQLASMFRPHGPHNVQMETGHTLLPMTHPDAFGPNDLSGQEVRGPQVAISHRNEPSDYFSIPLGHDPHQWMPNLVRSLGSRPVMERMRAQMSGPYGDE